MTKFLLKCVKVNDKNRQWLQILATISASITFIISGLVSGWTSPSIPKLMANDSSIPMTFEETSYFAIIHPLAMIAFVPGSAYLIERFGRKKLILSICIPHLATFIMVGFAKSTILLFLSRVTSGIGDAMIANALPTYVGEITEKHIRGPLGCLFMTNFFIGQIVINAVGYYFDISTTAFIVAVFPILHFVTFLPMPESPYWLIANDRVEDAKTQLQLLRWRTNVDEELSDIRKAVHRQLSEQSTIRDVFAIDSNRRAFIMAMLTRFAQQFAGLSAFYTYLQYIFQQAGGNIPSHVSSIIFMGLMMVGTLSASALIDKFGRRPLMLVSGTGSALMLYAQAIFFYLKEVTDTSAVSWLPLVFFLLYTIVYSNGFTVIPTMLLGELFSASIKGKAMTLANIAFGCLMLTTAKIFQVLADYVGLYAPFLFFAICTTISTISLYIFLVETKNRTLEEIQLELKRRK